jgi:hypothetical protein
MVDGHGGKNGDRHRPSIANAAVGDIAGFLDSKSIGSPSPLHLTTRLPIEEWSQERAMAAWEALKAEIQERHLHLGGRRYTRDEPHERRGLRTE